MLNLMLAAAVAYSAPIQANTCDVNNIAWVTPGKFMRSGAVIVDRNHLAGERATDGPAVTAAYKKLKATYHVGAVVNLRGESDEDEAAAKAAGMRFLHLPIEDGAPPTPEQVKTFFTFVKESRAKKQVVLWHCAGGIGRTGIFAGMLRIKSGWSTKDAVTEMFKMGLNYNQAQDHLPALNNFAAALGKPGYYPADWRGPRKSRYDYGAVARTLPAVE
jgi:protein tyrosine phosphatase (PTP) superfamily phosphohydrolase (DUF442 family)